MTYAVRDVLRRGVRRLFCLEGEPDLAKVEAFIEVHAFAGLDELLE